MPDLNFSLHKKQLEIFNSPARFKVVSAGRRGGKSYLSAVTLLIEALKEKNRFGMSLKGKETWYVAPTFQQGKDIMWGVLKEMGEGLIESAHENTATLKLLNGRTIKIKGSDRPDTLRGVSLAYVVMDEYASMKPEVWDMIISPALSDTRGDALFIGTPSGKNHFYELWMEASTDNDDEWESFQFNSLDNPLISKEELEKARLRMSAQAFRQEFEASFEAAGGGAFSEEDFIFEDQPREAGNIWITVDPAGFGTGDGMVKSNLKKLDETAIAVVEVSPSGWFVHDVIHGRWGIRETSLQIIRAAQRYKPAAVGIEKGSLKNAIMPYLEDQMRRLSTYPNITELTHGGKKKQERILWALQGRFQNGRIIFKKGASYVKPLLTQLLDFPNPLTHDDLCFPAYTPIVTDKGIKPIVEVTTDDYVLTRKGYKRVLKAVCTGNKEVITRFGITATHNHEVWTENRGYVSLDALCYTDTVIGLHKDEDSCEKQLNSTVESTTDIQTPNKTVTENITQATISGKQRQGHSTEMCGNSIMAQSQKDIISIMLMETGTTTTSQTSNASPVPNTKSSMQKKGEQEHQHQSGSNDWTISGISLKNGMPVKKVDNGIENTLNDLQTEQICQKSLVPNVENSLSQKCLSTLSALESAETIDKRELQGKKEPVYDLLVEDEHEFFAWGVLVHNCDALSYIDQISSTVYYDESFLGVNEYEPLDLISGF